ncbi:MAG: S41 family peptidase [Bacteroidales bacterium]|nr:S41 family peptidase [Bacteroidales bacterium]
MALDKQTGRQILQVILGVVFGALITLTVVKYREQQHLISTKYKDWGKLNTVLQMVEGNYVDTVNREDLTDAAVVATLARLDPHSVYMPPVEREASEEELAGNFEGIGIQFNVPNDTAIVLEVIPGGPSEKVGLMPGDRLLKVDDKVIAGVHFPQDSMVRRMKGPAGTKVTVTVKRASEEIPFEITRGKIPMHSVDAAFMLKDTVGYLRLAKFSRTTFQECRKAALGLVEQGMTHLIFDVRDNVGGYLDQALLLCNDYLSRGDTILYIQGLHRPREVYKADGNGKLKDVALTVLISENSASASEIFAGAIQDNDRGRVVGRRSFGKGLVQEPFLFSDGSGIRLTVARYYTPSGRCIQKPYTSARDYSYDIYNRYLDGEVFSADSVRLDTTDVHHTRGGRVVYGGGGIMPDVFVPMDTTRATKFYTECNRKATQMRFASAMFDRYSARILAIDNFPAMDRFLSGIDWKVEFPAYAKRQDGIGCTEAEWDASAPYLVPQLKALVSRYSKLGENAFYKYYLPVDNTVEVALQ